MTVATSKNFFSAFFNFLYEICLQYFLEQLIWNHWNALQDFHLEVFLSKNYVIKEQKAFFEEIIFIILFSLCAESMEHALTISLGIRLLFILKQFKEYYAIDFFSLFVIFVLLDPRTYPYWYDYFLLVLPPPQSQ